MKVLLVDPPDHGLHGAGGRQVHPLGLGYLAAVLAPDHDVVQAVPDVRPASAGDPWDALADALRAEAPDVVGIGAVTAAFPSARRVAALVRQVLGPDVPVVLGGVHASFRPDDALADPAMDYVVRGEGEETLRDLLAALEAGRSPEGVAGLLWRGEDGGVRHGPPRAPIADLDALPFPKRDGVLWPEHLEPAFYQSLVTVRGCPYQCIYCSVPASSARRTRYRSAADVADEIATLRDRWDVPYLFFHDSVFTLNRKRTLALCDQVLERDLVVPYACQTRADRVDPALLERMKAAGCHQIFFGIESGDVESLARIRKKMPLETIREAVDRVKRLGIRCTGFFMVGFPWETEQHIRRTADFATDLGLDAVSLFSATPLPGTELWDVSRERPIPERIDFRAPELNLTAMEPERYAALFLDVKARLDAYNRERMMAAMAHWPSG